MLYVTYAYRAPNDRLFVGAKVLNRPPPRSEDDVRLLRVALEEFAPSARELSVMGWMPLVIPAAPAAGA